MSRQITLTLYSLSERMPDVDTDVLVFDSEDPTGVIGAYVGDDDDGPMWVNSHGMPIFNVTDWADLPSRADAQEAPAALTDGRGTDVQIERERDIARHAIVGALAAGYAGASHPGDAHWLAAAHDAGMRIKSLEDAAQSALAALAGWRLEDIGPQIHIYAPDGKWTAVLKGSRSPAQSHIHSFLSAMLSAATKLEPQAPADSAPGYEGRNVEADHGVALVHALTYLRPAPAQPMTPEQRADVTRTALERMKNETGLSWHEVLMDEVEAHYCGITTQDGEAS